MPNPNYGPEADHDDSTDTPDVEAASDPLEVSAELTADADSFIADIRTAQAAVEDLTESVEDLSAALAELDSVVGDGDPSEDVADAIDQALEEEMAEMRRQFRANTLR